MIFKLRKFCKVIFILLIVVLVSCNAKNGVAPVSDQRVGDKRVFVKEEWKVFSLKDMDGDKKKDKAYVYTPAYYGTKSSENNGAILFDSCADNNRCYNKIKFSGNYPEILFENSLWGSIEPIGDLDEDGINEFIFQTNWFIGTHVSIYIYSFDIESKQWVVLAHNWLYGNDSYKDRITKIDKSEFKFRIEYMDTVEGDIMEKDTVIQIKK